MSTSERRRQVTQKRKGLPELGIFREALAVLLLWAMEEANPSLDPLMSAPVQVHG